MFQPFTQAFIDDLPTDQTFPLTTAQRGPTNVHPRHVAGGILVHITGMMGWAHAYHLPGLRHKDGWLGYGTHIHTATFRKLVTLGPPVMCTANQKKARKISGKIFSTYQLKYEQSGEEVFVSEQSAIWLQP